MNRKLICLILSAVMFLGLLAACADASADEAESVTSLEFAEAEPEVKLGALTDNVIPLAETPAISSVIKPVASGKSVKENSKALIDYSNINDGYVMIKWKGSKDLKLKVKIVVPSDAGDYNFDLRADGEYEVFPISEGNGKYTVKVYYQKEGSTKYTCTLSLADIDVKLTDEFMPFLTPNQYVNFSADSKCVKEAEKLCKGLEDNLEKVSVVYDWVVQNFSYDHDKANDALAGKIKSYVPNVDEIYDKKVGICFDYAAVMTSMLRSQGVPCKLITGVAGEANHAWINVWSEKNGWIEAQIYFDGKEWKLMDPTWASSAAKLKTEKARQDAAKKLGDGSNYTQKFQY